LLQPLDVGVFNAYKHHHSEAIEAATISSCQKFTKDEFLAGIASIRAKTFKLSTIRLVFRLTGLWPYNPDIVVDQLVDYDLYRRSPTLSSDGNNSTSTQFSTPKTVQRFQKLEHRLQELNRSSQRFNTALDKLLKAGRVQSHLVNELRSDLQGLQHAQSVREARRNTSRRQARVSGIITSNQIMNMKRAEKKLDDLEALDRLRPRWKKVMKELKQRCRQLGRRIR